MKKILRDIVTWFGREIKWKIKIRAIWLTNEHINPSEQSNRCSLHLLWTQFVSLFFSLKGEFYLPPDFYLTFLCCPPEHWKAITVSKDKLHPRWGSRIRNSIWPERALREGPQRGQEIRLPRHLLYRKAPNLCRGNNKRTEGRRPVNGTPGRVSWMYDLMLHKSSLSLVQELKHSHERWQSTFSSGFNLP